MKSTVRVVPTADGSSTVFNDVLGKTYHSIHGAIQESQRVYIDVGLLAAFEKFPDQELQLFEMGFGTGLNALLTLREAERYQRRVQYVAIDAYPLPLADAQELNYDQVLGTTALPILHQSPWEKPVQVSPYMSLTKLAGELQALDLGSQFHLIYYDAFAPSAQPELWEPAIFEQLAALLLPGGMLTTYCAKSYVQRNMRSAGLTVEKHPGPFMKRDILRAVK
jgi:tRNA U34 5-methylaminomethyl-2-thiouridine-forming methyltransferase MnmC